MVHTRVAFIGLGLTLIWMCVKLIFFSSDWLLVGGVPWEKQSVRRAMGKESVTKSTSGGNVTVEWKNRAGWGEGNAQRQRQQG